MHKYIRFYNYHNYSYYYYKYMYYTTVSKKRKGLVTQRSLAPVEFADVQSQ